LKAWLFDGPANGKVLEIFPPFSRIYIPVMIPISVNTPSTPQNSVIKRAVYDRCGSTPLFFFNKNETC